MKKANFLFFLILQIIVACKKGEASLESSCEEQFLEANQLTEYEGQDLGCNTYVALYELEGVEYFYADNHCADMISMPLDCAGNAYCADLGCPELNYFFTHAEFKGIVGF